MAYAVFLPAAWSVNRQFMGPVFLEYRRSFTRHWFRIVGLITENSSLTLLLPSKALLLTNENLDDVRKAIQQMADQPIKPMWYHELGSEQDVTFHKLCQRILKEATFGRAASSATPSQLLDARKYLFDPPESENPSSDYKKYVRLSQS